MATLNQLVTQTTDIKNTLISCHTNLKNNLEENGIVCSDTDKMPTLIEKVKNLQSVNIKVASSLPSSAKEGDIVILCNYTYSKIIVSSKEPALVNNQIWLAITESAECDINFNNVNFVSRVVNSKIKINGALEKLNVYKYINSSFVHINSDLDIYICPTYYNQDIYGGMISNEYDNGGVETSTKKDTNEGIEIYLSRDDYGECSRNICTKNKIDLTLFKTVEFKYKVVEAKGSYSELFFGVSSSSSVGGRVSTSNNYLANKNNNTVVSDIGKELSVSLDISNINTSAHVNITAYTASDNYLKVLIKSIRLIK